MYYEIKDIKSGVVFQVVKADNVDSAFKALGLDLDNRHNYGVSITYIDPRISYLAGNRRQYTQEYLDSLKEEEVSA